MQRRTLLLHYRMVSRNTEYRIYGTIEIQYDLVLFGIEGTYEIELTVDCDK